MLRDCIWHPGVGHSKEQSVLQWLCCTGAESEALQHTGEAALRDADLSILFSSVNGPLVHNGC